MDALQALNSFWNSFDIPAYDENTVPDEAQMPYITYEAPRDSFDHTVAQTVSLWYRSSGWKDITSKEKEISERITRGGINVRYNDGAIWIKKGSPWSQRMSEDSNSEIRRLVLNLEMEYLD